MWKFLKNPCNIYISLLTFYSMQGTMIPTGGTVLSQMIALITMLMGLYYTMKVVAMKVVATLLSSPDTHKSPRVIPIHQSTV